MSIRKKFDEFNADITYNHLFEDITEPPEPKACKCGEVLRGVLYPQECPLFGTKCNPQNPVGPCIVSIEGACNIEYRYKDD